MGVETSGLRQGKEMGGSCEKGDELSASTRAADCLKIWPKISIWVILLVCTVGIARSEPDGTRWLAGGEVKGKDANGVGSQQPSTVRRNTVYTIAVRWSALLDCQ